MMGVSKSPGSLVSSVVWPLPYIRFPGNLWGQDRVAGGSLGTAPGSTPYWAVEGVRLHRKWNCDAVSTESLQISTENMWSQMVLKS